MKKMDTTFLRRLYYILAVITVALACIHTLETVVAAASLPITVAASDYIDDIRTDRAIWTILLIIQASILAVFSFLLLYLNF